MYLVDYDVIMLDNHQVQVEEMYLPHTQMDEFYENENLFFKKKRKQLIT